LLGCFDVDDELRALLMKHRGQGFEAALGELQAQAHRAGRPTAQMQKMQAALTEMFDNMTNGYVDIAFDPSNLVDASVRRFLAQFDAIFTLNQDTLLEAHYLNPGLVMLTDRWDGWIIPGMRPIVGHPTTPDRPALTLWQPDGQAPAIPARHQPYIKLHGSYNWRTENGQDMLIMGSEKSAAIAASPVLTFGMDTFKRYVSRPETRVMVIGYSFQDDHINKTLMFGAKAPGFRLFVVDPRGLDALDPPEPRRPVKIATEIAQALLPKVRGCSHRALMTTFSGDAVERSYLYRFLTQL